MDSANLKQEIARSGLSGHFTFDCGADAAETARQGQPIIGSKATRVRNGQLRTCLRCRAYVRWSTTGTPHVSPKEDGRKR